MKDIARVVVLFGELYKWVLFDDGSKSSSTLIAYEQQPPRALDGPPEHSCHPHLAPHSLPYSPPHCRHNRATVATRGLAQVVLHPMPYPLSFSRFLRNHRTLPTHMERVI